MPFPKVSNETVSGLAQVKSNNDKTKFQVIVTKKVSGGGDVTKTFVIKAENCPKYLKPGIWSVKVSSDGNRMFSAIPSEGTFLCQFHDIVHRENEEPVPMKKSGAYGDYLQFIMLFKIIEGELVGEELAMFLSYNFVPKIDDNGHEVVAIKMSERKPSKSSLQLEEVMDAIGAADAPMAWKDNILPVIKRRATKAVDENNRKVNILVTNGWPTKVRQVIDEGDTAWDEEVEETTTAAPTFEETTTEFTPVSEPEVEEEASTTISPTDSGNDGEIAGNWVEE